VSNDDKRGAQKNSFNSTLYGVDNHFAKIRRERMKIMKFIIIFTGFYLLIVISMNFSNPGEVRGGDFYGKVVDPDGNAIPGVRVVLTSATLVGERIAITSSNGYYRFFGLSPGEYHLTFELEGFKTVVLRNIDLSFGKTTGLSITMDMIDKTSGVDSHRNKYTQTILQGKGSIRGKVIEPDGYAIPGVLVALSSADSDYEKKIVIANSKGVFRFDNLPAGRFHLKLERVGFKTVVLKNISISAGSTKELSTITMAAKIIVLENDYGINPYKKKAVPKNDSNFYYMEKKLFAKYGVAKVDSTEKDLKDITMIPYKSEDYHKGGLDIITRGVYVILLDQKGEKLLFIRVIEILKGKIKVEYHPSE
jgi:hypothetical protein